MTRAYADDPPGSAEQIYDEDTIEFQLSPEHVATLSRAELAQDARGAAAAPATVASRAPLQVTAAVTFPASLVPLLPESAAPVRPPVTESLPQEVRRQTAKVPPQVPASVAPPAVTDPAAKAPAAPHFPPAPKVPAAPVRSPAAPAAAAPGRATGKKKSGAMPLGRWALAGVGLGVLALAVVVLLQWPAHRDNEPAPPPPPPKIAAPEVAAPVAEPVVDTTQPPPVRFRNPFDHSEVFEFPAGTSVVDARQAVAEILLQRAQERHPVRFSKSRRRAANTTTDENASVAQNSAHQGR